MGCITAILEPHYTSLPSGNDRTQEDDTQENADDGSSSQIETEYMLHRMGEFSTKMNGLLERTGHVEEKLHEEETQINSSLKNVTQCFVSETSDGELVDSDHIMQLAAHTLESSDEDQERCMEDRDGETIREETVNLHTQTEVDTDPKVERALRTMRKLDKKLADLVKVCSYTWLSCYGIY